MIAGEKSHGLNGLVMLYGIESPGLTASLAIGEQVANLITQQGEVLAAS
jgi:L-2-hydroxyglutarate oxidase LhgO